jgi:hypothetical protein
MKYWIKVLLTPSCWIRNYPYSKEYDDICLKQLENPVFTNVGEHYAQLNGKLVWINNYPYAAFHLERGRLAYKLPSRRTVFKLKEALEAQRPIKQPFKW